MSKDICWLILCWFCCYSVYCLFILPFIVLFCFVFLFFVYSLIGAWLFKVVYLNAIQNCSEWAARYAINNNWIVLGRLWAVKTSTIIQHAIFPEVSPDATTLRILSKDWRVGSSGTWHLEGIKLEKTFNFSWFLSLCFPNSNFSNAPWYLPLLLTFIIILMGGVLKTNMIRPLVILV